MSNLTKKPIDRFGQLKNWLQENQIDGVSPLVNLNLNTLEKSLALIHDIANRKLDLLQIVRGADKIVDNYNEEAHKIMEDFDVRR